MTMNKSLRVRKGGGGNRGVLSRAERITKLKELEKWEEGQSPLGLPKVRVQKISMKKKMKFVHFPFALIELVSLILLSPWCQWTMVRILATFIVVMILEIPEDIISSFDIFSVKTYSSMRPESQF